WDPPHALRFISWPTHRFETPAIVAESSRKTTVAGALLPVVSRTTVFRAPVGARPWLPELTHGIPIIGERLDLSEWVHIAAQGRDHYVRIVYEGHLYPFGHRAALIKITERKFRDAPLPDGGSTPVAQMIQREYIVVREPEK